MSKIDELLLKYCPNGVVFKPLWSLVYFDKRFNGVDKKKQPKVLAFEHVSAEKLKSLNSGGNVRLLSTGKFDGFTSVDLAGESLNEGEVISIPSGGAANIKYFDGLFVDGGNILCSTRDKEVVLLKYIYHFLLKNNDFIQSCFRGGSVQHPEMAKIIELLIPVPPLLIQKEIVNVLDNYSFNLITLKERLNNEILTRKKQFEYYRDELLSFDGSVTIKTLGELSCIVRGASPRPINEFITDDPHGVNWIKIGDVQPGAKYITSTKEKITEEGAKHSRFVKKGDFILSNSMSFGRPYILNIDGCIHDGWLSISNFQAHFVSDFLYHLLSSTKVQRTMKQKASFGGAVQNLNADIVRSLELPVPPLEVQKRIVVLLDKLDLLTTNILTALSKEVEARQKQHDYYREQLLTFKELKN